MNGITRKEVERLVKERGVEVTYINKVFIPKYNQDDILPDYNRDSGVTKIDGDMYYIIDEEVK